MPRGTLPCLSCLQQDNSSAQLNRTSSVVELEAVSRRSLLHGHRLHETSNRLVTPLCHWAHSSSSRCSSQSKQLWHRFGRSRGSIVGRRPSPSSAPSGATGVPGRNKLSVLPFHAIAGERLATDGVAVKAVNVAGGGPAAEDGMVVFATLRVCVCLDCKWGAQTWAVGSTAM